MAMQTIPFYRRPGFQTAFGLLFLMAVYLWALLSTRSPRPLLVLALDVLLGGFTLILMVSLTAQFVLPVRGWSDRLSVVQRLLSYLLGTRGPVMSIDDGRAVEDIRERERAGAGVLLIDHTSAAVLRNNTGFTRAIGPGIYFTYPGERLAEALSLRRQVRSIQGKPPPDEPLEDGDFTSQALTQDGIPISADLSVTFMLHPNPDNPSSSIEYPLWPPYPFSEVSAARAVYGRSYGEGEDLPWSQLPLRLVVDLWRERAKRRRLQDLLRDRSLLQQIKHEIEYLLKPPPRPALKNYGELDERGFWEYELLKQRGILALEVSVSNLRLPPRIRDEAIIKWREKWSGESRRVSSQTQARAKDYFRYGQEEGFLRLCHELTWELSEALDRGDRPDRGKTMSMILTAAANLSASWPGMEDSEAIAEEFRTMVKEIRDLRKKEKCWSYTPED